MELDFSRFTEADYQKLKRAKGAAALDAGTIYAGDVQIDLTLVPRANSAETMVTMNAFYPHQPASRQLPDGYAGLTAPSYDLDGILRPHAVLPENRENPEFEETYGDALRHNMQAFPYQNYPFTDALSIPLYKLDGVTYGEFQERFSNQLSQLELPLLDAETVRSLGGRDRLKEQYEDFQTAMQQDTKFWRRAETAYSRTLTQVDLENTIKARSGQNLESFFLQQFRRMARELSQRNVETPTLGTILKTAAKATIRRLEARTRG